MDRHRRHLLLALAVLVLGGLAKLPLERALTTDLRERELLRPPLELETTRKLGQGFWAVSLGGLRTLVATVLNLRAQEYFEGQKWTQLTDTFGTIVQLAPFTEYYWDIGAWHMAYNAAAWHQHSSPAPELRRRAEWRNWIERGVDFLEEGLRHNPDDWRLWNNLGRIHSDPNKILDFEAAAEAYASAVATGDAPSFVARAEARARARIPGREDAALPLVRRLHDQPGGDLPTMQALRFVLEHRADPERDLRELALSIFDSPERAWERLGDYYLSIRDRYPMDGVATLLRRLEDELGIPPQRSMLAARERLEADNYDPWQR